MTATHNIRAVLVALEPGKATALLRTRPAGRPIGGVKLYRDEEAHRFLPPAGPMAEWASPDFVSYVAAERERGVSYNAPVVAALGAVNAEVAAEAARWARCVG